MWAVGGSYQKHKESTLFSYPSPIFNLGNVTAHSVHSVSQNQRWKRRTLYVFPDNSNVNLWTIWDVCVKCCDICASLSFSSILSACSEQKLLAKQKYIIIAFADVLSKTKLYFSLSFHWEEVKEEKTAEYIDTSKQGKTEVVFVALYWEIV